MRPSPLAWLLLIPVVAGCSPPDKKWQKIAEMTNSDGRRFVVAQQHYDWVEGWAVSFFTIDSRGNIFGSSLQIESDRWRDVRLTQTNDMVKVWHVNQLVGTYTSSNGVFKNCIYNFDTTYTNGGVYSANRFLD